jgi:hypothetical protein
MQTGRQIRETIAGIARAPRENRRIHRQDQCRAAGRFRAADQGHGEVAIRL